MTMSLLIYRVFEISKKNEIKEVAWLNPGTGRESISSGSGLPLLSACLLFDWPFREVLSWAPPRQSTPHRGLASVTSEVLPGSGYLSWSSRVRGRLAQPRALLHSQWSRP